MKGLCRSCYSREYQKDQRREAGIQPKAPVGPASGGVKLEFWVSRQMANRLAAAEENHGDRSRILREALEEKLWRLSEAASEKPPDVAL